MVNENKIACEKNKALEACCGDVLVLKMYNELENKLKITPALIMKIYKLNLEVSEILARKIWLLRHKEARKMAKELEYQII